ncbi:MAG: BON domain-containing protein [Sandaracinaceae bacterium]
MRHVRIVFAVAALSLLGCGGQEHGDDTTSHRHARADRADRIEDDGVDEDVDETADDLDDDLDDDGAPVTAEDQGNDPEDLRITQELRQAVSDDSRLSMSAKQVVIVTRDCVVTLAGPRVSSSERDVIGELAMGVEGVRSVRNRLEVAN